MRFSSRGGLRFKPESAPDPEGSSDVIPITEQSTVDWEPFHFWMKCDEGNVSEATRLYIHGALDGWMRRRAVSPVCGAECFNKYLSVSASLNAPGFDVDIQWVCRECVDSIFGLIANACPYISAIVVGVDDPRRAAAPHGDDGSLSVASRPVTLEDGRQVRVGPFRTSVQPVSVAEYMHFVERTGYVTSAEIKGSARTFVSNPFIESGVDPRKDLSDALFLSCDDALAYCWFSKTRMLTEPEVMAAMTIGDDVRVMSSDERRETVLSGSVCRFTELLPIITATVEGGKVVARKGPYVVKEPGWEGLMARNRLLIDKNHPIGQFYCRKDGEGE